MKKQERSLKMMNWNPLFENAFYLLALLNPASKIMFLTGYQPQLTKKQIFELAWKSSLAALIILILLAGAGDFILSRIFRVELYSLQITGGLILFFMGWSAIREGKFMQKKQEEMRADFTEISLVPLAAPLIAGPGTIAASIASSAETGWGSTCLALTIALSVNFLLMMFSDSINKALLKTHLLGPLIRLTGLIIAAVAMQMILSGIKVCFTL